MNTIFGLTGILAPQCSFDILSLVDVLIILGLHLSAEPTSISPQLRVSRMGSNNIDAIRANEYAFLFGF